MKLILFNISKMITHWNDEKNYQWSISHYFFGTKSLKFGVSFYVFSLSLFVSIRYSTAICGYTIDILLSGSRQWGSTQGGECASWGAHASRSLANIAWYLLDGKRLALSDCLRVQRVLPFKFPIRQMEITGDFFLFSFFLM